MFLSLFRFLTNCRKILFFFRLKFVCTRSTKEFLRTALNVSVRFKSNWNLEVLVNMKRGKPEYPEKNSWNKEKNQQQTQPTYGVDAGFAPRPYWWKASALTAAPPSYEVTTCKVA